MTSRRTKAMIPTLGHRLLDKDEAQGSPRPRPAASTPAANPPSPTSRCGSSDERAAAGERNRCWPPNGANYAHGVGSGSTVDNHTQQLDHIRQQLESYAKISTNTIPDAYGDAYDAASVSHQRSYVCVRH